MLEVTLPDNEILCTVPDVVSNAGVAEKVTRFAPPVITTPERSGSCRVRVLPVVILAAENAAIFVLSVDESIVKFASGTAINGAVSVLLVSVSVPANVATVPPAKGRKRVVAPGGSACRLHRK